MFKLKQSFILINIAFLAACSSNGGSFDVDSVKQNTEKKAEYKPKYADDDSAPRRKVTDAEANALTQPGLGYATKIPRRNQFSPTQPEEIGEILSISGPLNKLPYEDEVRGYGSNDEDFIHTHDNKKLHHQRNLDFVRSGYLLHLGAKTEVSRTPRVLRNGPTGYVYYIGEQPAKALPAQTATYNGYWDFTTDARARNSNEAGYFSDGAANRYGATSEDNNANVDDKTKPVGHTSRFEVDFSNKKLTGTLTKNGHVKPNGSQEITDIYNIEANIKGNRFIGKAKAKNANDPYFGKDSNSLEGGFFGPNAQELAGKFLADDKSIFVVFAGKRDSKEGDAEQAFDAVKVRLSDLSKTDLDTFGRATHLVIGGRQVPLLADGKSSFSEMAFDDVITRNIGGKNYKITVCCNNLDYVKFGTYKEDGTQDGYQYLVGERTAVRDLPSGKTFYRGTWNGVIDSKDGKRGGDSPSNKDGGTRALFDVDFGDKSIKGKLIANNGVDDRPMLSLDGKIQGNGFTGTAKTGTDGFNIDPGSTAGGTVVHLNAPFSGGFYGKNAAELGGVVHSAEANQDKVSITFGGKRQVEQ